MRNHDLAWCKSCIAWKKISSFPAKSQVRSSSSVFAYVFFLFPSCPVEVESPMGVPNNQGFLPSSSNIFSLGDDEDSPVLDTVHPSWLRRCKIRATGKTWTRCPRRGLRFLVACLPPSLKLTAKSNWKEAETLNESSLPTICYVSFRESKFQWHFKNGLAFFFPIS